MKKILAIAACAGSAFGASAVLGSTPGAAQQTWTCGDERGADDQPRVRDWGTGGGACNPGVQGGRRGCNDGGNRGGWDGDGESALFDF